MTKAEKIENLELQLKVALIELGEYRKKEERIVYAETTGAEYDYCRGFRETIVIRSSPAPYGAARFDYEGFQKALAQFLAKWNEAALEARENQFKQPSAANVPRQQNNSAHSAPLRLCVKNKTTTK